MRRRVYTYTSGKVKIKSDIELSSEQIAEICDIIDYSEEMSINYGYGDGYNIARSIFYKIGPPISGTQFFYKGRNKFLVKLIKEQ